VIRIFAVLLLGGVFASLVSCGGDTRTVTERHTTTVIREATPQPSDAEQTDRPSEQSGGTAPQAEVSEPSGSSGGTIKIPNVVGKDHQLAQDTMQSAGLYNLSEEDVPGKTGSSSLIETG
jgi:hypothetical protein